MYDRINIKSVYRNTSIYWSTLNPILPIGMIYYEIDTNKIKISDGITNYNQLPYINGVNGIDGEINDENILTEINNIKNKLTSLQNDFDAVDLGEISDKAEDDMVVHKKGYSSLESIEGPKDFIDKITLSGNTNIELGDITNTAATTKYVTDSVNDLRNNLPSTSNIDAKIVEHNLSNQSHNDIRNSIKTVSDSLAVKANLASQENVKIGNIAIVDKDGQYEVSDTKLSDLNDDIDILNQQTGILTTSINDIKDDYASKTKDNTFTGKNIFNGDVVLGANIRNKVNDKVIITTKTIDANTQATYVGGDQIEIYAPDSLSVESDSVVIKRNNESGVKQTYTNIDSGNISQYVTNNSTEMEKYGIEADYAVHYGIIDCPQGLIEFNASNKNIIIKAGIVLQAAGQDARTTIASDINYTIQETGKITLFYVAGEIIEAGDVFFQEAEPDNGVTSYLAWYKPSLGKWQFKSNDTGNVWRTAIATPIANVNAGATTIISINYIGYRIFDDDCFASLSDIDSINETISTMQDSVNELFTEVDKKQATLLSRQLLTGTIDTVSDVSTDADLTTLISSFNNLLAKLRARGVIG